MHVSGQDFVINGWPSVGSHTRCVVALYCFIYSVQNPRVSSMRYPSAMLPSGWVRSSIIFQGLHVPLNWIHPAAVDRPTYEKLLNKVYWEMRHDVQKCWRKLLLQHAGCHNHVLHHTVLLIFSNFFLANFLEDSADFYDCPSYILVQQIPNSHREYLPTMKIQSTLRGNTFQAR